MTATTASARVPDAPYSGGVLVNDVHSALNPATVYAVVQPRSIEDVRWAIAEARSAGLSVSIAGGRHAMGGQQAADGALLLDTTAMDRVLAFDPEAGEIEAEAGITWPALMGWLDRAQDGVARPWGIAQKQTGADRLTLGGALSANVHGRVLGRGPIVGDVAGFTLVDAEGAVRRCSRHENPDLFRLAIGGYGLFGVITGVRLRLERRRTVRRLVEVRAVEGLMDAFADRVAEGCRFGDFQFAIDPHGEDFLRVGVFSCYRDEPGDPPLPAGQRALRRDDWRRLMLLAHTDKRQATDRYISHYLSTHGQLYRSDRAQLADYEDGYHTGIDRATGAVCPGSEMITELYVPRPALPAFLAAVRDDARTHGTDIVYGTVRLIERDDETVLAWAREPWACVVFNLHVRHDEAGVAAAAEAFRRLIDRALAFGGSYYLTYHAWATRAQVEAAHPRVVEFLRAKLAHDPAERFQSKWYRSQRAMFAGVLIGDSA